MIINLFLIAIFWVFVIDYASFVSTIEEAVSKRLTRSKMKFHIPRPFSCSLCMTFWTGLAYILITNNFSIMNLIWVSAASASTPIIDETLQFVRDAVIKIIYLLRSIFNI